MATAAWTPINENHAIAVMGAYIRFIEPLPDLLFKKSLRRVADAADKLGLTSVGVAQRLAVEFGEEGMKPSEKLNTTGQMFTRLVGLDDGEEPSFRKLEQVQFDHSALVYRAWEYISWEWQSERIRSIFSSLIDVVGESVIFEAVGIEYLDRFRSTADVPGSKLDELLRRDGKLIASNIFEAPSLFHSHTGSFSGDLSSPILQVVRIDALDDDAGRWVNITTTQEKRYGPDTVENGDVFKVMEEAHTDLKNLLAEVITPEQSKRIYLQD